MKQKNSIATTILIVKLLFLLGSFAMATEHFSRFPGLSEVSSPDGRYLLKNPEGENGELIRCLFLRDNRTNTEKEFYTYDRDVDVLWSKDSKGLIINDHGGSNWTNCIIFQFTNKGIEKYDVEGLLRNRNVRNKKSIVGNDHVYINGERWITNNKIKILITGHGDVDPDGFTLWYEYTIGGKFKFIAKKSQDSPEP